jgi:transcription termination factor Rho
MADADRIFKNVAPILKGKNCALIRPPSVGKTF